MSRQDKGKGIATGDDRKRSRYTSVPKSVRGRDKLRTSLDSCTVHPTRFVDWETMARLGVRDDMETIFSNMGLRQYMHLREHTHIDETIQLLGSLLPFVLGDSCVYAGIDFTIHGESYRLTIEDLRMIYGFQSFDAGDDSASELGMMDMWHHTANGAYQMGRAKASNIRSPVVKLIQRSLGYAFLGRFLVGPVTTEEWRLTCFGLRPLIGELEPPVRDIPTCDPALHFIGNLRVIQDYARAKKSEDWPLSIGGTLTPIFRHCGIQLSDPILTIPMIDMAHLRNCHFLTRADTPTYPFTWDGRYQELVLPCPRLAGISIPGNIRFRHILDGRAHDEGHAVPPDHDAAPVHDEAPQQEAHDQGTSSRQPLLHYTRRTLTERRLAAENSFLKNLVQTLCQTVRALKGRVRSLERHTGHSSRTYQSEAQTKRRHDHAAAPQPSSPTYDITTPPASDTETDSA